jgi:predicted dehydrogenase
MADKIKLGIFGARRGEHLLSSAELNGFVLTAICDHSEPLLRKVQKKYEGRNIAFYHDYDEFLTHDFDAVIVANYATEHVEPAIKALASGRHVMSECMAMFTMAEGVRLVEAVERYGKVYFFAENYPFMLQNQEMARLYQSGEMGHFLYGEGEYIHPFTPEQQVPLMSGPEHWRSWLPVSYYCTHSMGPVMLITGTRPVQVNGLIVPHSYDAILNGPGSIKINDCMSILMCRMDNGALAKIMPCAQLRDHGNRCRICCSKGSMEWGQGHDGILRVHREPFDCPEGRKLNSYYHPGWPEGFAAAGSQGHGGSDFFTSYYFAQAIREKCPPKIDVYMATAMSAIGIQGYKSALQGGVPMEVPDFRKADVRDRYRDDEWNPDPARHREGYPLSSVLGKIDISEENLALFAARRKAFEEGL